MGALWLPDSTAASMGQREAVHRDRYLHRKEPSGCVHVRPSARSHWAQKRKRSIQEHAQPCPGH